MKPVTPAFIQALAEMRLRAERRKAATLQAFRVAKAGERIVAMLEKARAVKQG